MKKPLLSVFTLLLIFFSSGLSAQQKSSNDSLATKLDEYLNSAVQAGQFNGTALVAKNGWVILQKGYGWKNFEKHTLIM